MNRIVLTLLLMVFYCVAFAKEYYVGGTDASDNNPGTALQPFATIQKAASLAVAGDIIKIRSGTYRETIVPANSGTAGNPIIYEPDGNSSVIISGTNTTEGGWTLHSGNIYKKAITLPINGYQRTLTSNTTLLANQVFKDGVMMFEARWPKLNTPADLLDRTKLRKRSSTSTFNDNTLSDTGLPGGLTGARIHILGWFLAYTRTITNHSGTTISYSTSPGGEKFKQYYYVTGKLNLLTQAKEWHYESGTLYFFQEGGGSPTGVEYKARNWGFDLRGKSGITINRLQFFGCEPMTGNTASTYTVLDGIKSKYQNHAFLQEDPDVIYSNAKQTGIKLIGANSIIRNSEIQYAASQGIWLGANCKAENNLITDISYEGNYGAGITLWDNDAGQVIAKNTMHRFGRSAIDFGYNEFGSHLNFNINMNDIYHFGMLNVDLGGIYGARKMNTTGSRIHHNWVHDSKATDDPSSLQIGINTGIYFDQAAGPVTVDHNVLWNNVQADFYNQQVYERTAGGSLLYNNTFATNAGDTHPNHHSYVTYVKTPPDVQRNNIYRDDINVSWGSGVQNIANVSLEGVNPQFIGTGAGGLAFRLNAGSPSINAGVALPGITDGNVGAPDIGAYEYGGTDWVPGYVPVATAPSTPAASVSISPVAVVTSVGGTSQLAKTVLPSTAANQNASWTTSNASVATVNSAGLVTAVAAGSATITATTQEGSMKATCAVTVNANATGVIDDAVVGTGTNQHNYAGAGWVNATGVPNLLNNTVSYSNVTSNTVTLPFVGDKVEWYNEKLHTHGIAAVSIDNGPEVNIDLYAATPARQVLVYSSPDLVQGNHTFKIRVTGTKNPASTGVYVVHDFLKVYSGSVPVQGVAISPSTSTLTMGGTTTVQLAKTVSPSAATNQNVLYTTSNASVATVNATGLVTAVAGGSATITATTQEGSFKATCTITVNANITPTGVTVSPSTLTLTMGGVTTMQLTKTVSPSTAANQNVLYTTSNASVATVNSTGLITAVAAGNATITVTTQEGSFKATCVVTVNANTTTTGVTVSPATSTLTMGGTTTVQLTKTVGPSTATNQNVLYTTSNAGVATVNSTGLVTAVAAGTATITATTQEGSFTATCAITVNAIVSATGVIDDAVLGTGTNQHNYVGTWAHPAGLPNLFNNTVSFSNVTNNTVTLSFVGNKIEWYNEKLHTHGIAAVSIDNGPEVNIDLYSATPVRQILVYSSPALVQGNHTFKIRVTGTKNPASTGVYVVHDFLKVYSGSVPVQGVAVSPSTSTLTIGGTTTVQLAQTVSPSAATNQNVLYTTSNASVATVNATGLVTAVATGNATITATTQEGSFKATCAVTVNANTTITGVIDDAVLGTGTNQHNYVGTWAHPAGLPNLFNNTVSFSNVTNNTVTLSFVGDKVEWYNEKLQTHGIAAVSIDNGPEVNIDLYSAAPVRQILVYSSPALAQGSHTFKIRVTGTKNPASTGVYVVHDFLKVYSSGGSGSGSGGGGAMTAQQEEPEAELGAYPNPLKSGDILYLEVPHVPGELKISDLMGKTIYTSQVTDTKLEIPTAGLTNGVHLLYYKSSKGLQSVKILIK